MGLTALSVELPEDIITDVYGSYRYHVGHTETFKSYPSTIEDATLHIHEAGNGLTTQSHFLVFIHGILGV